MSWVRRSLDLQRGHLARSALVRSGLAIFSPMMRNSLSVEPGVSVALSYVSNQND